MKVEFIEAAMREYGEAFDYYEGKKPGLGKEFRDETGNALARIIEFPLAWSKLSMRTRRCLTNRFPFGILYQVRSDRILIVGVMHMRRSPQHWLDRV